MTYDEMAKFLTENGWETLWHKENWIKTEWWKDPTKNVDTCGYLTEAAYQRCTKEKLMGC